MGRQAPPPNGPGQAKLVQNLRVVVCDSPREDPIFPGVCRRLETLQLPERFECSAISEQLSSRRNVLPTEEPAHELRGGDRLNLFSQRADGQAVNARQQSPVTPFDFVARSLRELPSQYRTTRFQTQQGLVDVCRSETQQLAQRRFCGRA